MTLELRPYQKECVDLINNLPDGSKGIIMLPTGTGKTVVFTSIDRAGRMLILSHRDELVRQPLKYFPQNTSIGIEKAEEHSAGEEVVSASVQSLSRDNRLNKFNPEDFSTIIVDEAHHAAAPTYRKILKYFKPKKLLGFTATPKRGDNVRLDDLFDSIIFERTILWGIQNGYLCNLKVLAVDANIDLKGVHFTAGDYNAKELSERIEIENVYEVISKTYGEHVIGTNRHVLLYCLTKKGCEEIKTNLVKHFPEEQEKIAIITADTPDELRKQYEQDYMNPEGTIRCLINCMVLTEGVDLPITDTIIINRPTANTTLYTQIVGRGTRLFEGKKECLVLEMMPNSSAHKLCSVSSLIGIDYDKLKKKQKALVDKGTDLLSLAEEIQKEKDRYERRITLIETKIDLFANQIKDELKEIIDSVANSVVDYSKQISQTEQENREAAIAEDGNIDTKGLHYVIGLSDDERYIINGDFNEDCKICIAKPDVLGNTHITAYEKDVVYQSEEMKINDAFASVYDYLNKNYEKKNYLWLESENARWKREKASDKQKNYIYAVLQEKGIEFDPKTVYNENLSKYDASAMINKLKNQDNLKTTIRELEEEHDRLQKSDQDEQLEVNNWSSIFDKEQRMKNYLTSTNTSTPTYDQEGNIKCSFEYSFSGFIQGGATEKQIAYCAVLLNKISNSISFPEIKILDYIKATPYNYTASFVITALKYLADNIEIIESADDLYTCEIGRILTKLEQAINGYGFTYNKWGKSLIEKENAFKCDVSLMLYKNNSNI